MERGVPDADTVRVAVALAVRAPSVRNTQPWRWRVGEETMHLYADPARMPADADPDQRDLLLSCGAALHHLRIGFGALGWSTVVRRLPDADDINQLAAVDFVPHRATAADIAMSSAIARRFTDRRPYSDRVVPSGHIGLIAERAAALGAVIRHVHGETRSELADAVRRTSGDPVYLADPLDVGRPAVAADIIARTGFQPEPDGDHPGRGCVSQVLAYRTQDVDAAELLVVGTPSDDRMSRLRAGEAISAALLTATNIGLATCVLTEPLTIPHVRYDILHDCSYPHAVIRVGWPPHGVELLPTTPRRTVEDVVGPIYPPE